MTATLYLVRHAAHDDLGRYLAGRAPGIRLGPEGLAQAQRLASRMAREDYHAIFASPRERAQQTAAAMAAAKPGISVETVDALDEIDYGNWSGCTFDELNRRKDWQHWNALRSLAQAPGGETMLDVQGRALGFIRRLAMREGDSRLALVSHADVIRAIVGHLLGLPIDAWQRFDVLPASITIAVVGSWGARLLSLNEVTA